MLDIPNKIKFRKVTNKFQTDLIKAVNDIKKNPNVILESDKTKNYYECPPELYKKLLTENVTKDYKLNGNEDIVSIINHEAAKISEKLNLDDRIDQFAHRAPYVTVKDHKVQFPARIEMRLINPAKSDIGLISKQILDKINGTIRAKTQAEQWVSTKQVINWFSSIENKPALLS